MRVLYKCRCMAAEASVEVADRQPSEDIADWMETLKQAVGADHFRRSPLCIAPATEYVKIPVPENAPFIGGAPKLDS